MAPPSSGSGLTCLLLIEVGRMWMWPTNTNGRGLAGRLPVGGPVARTADRQPQGDTLPSEISVRKERVHQDLDLVKWFNHKAVARNHVIGRPDVFLFTGWVNPRPT